MLAAAVTRAHCTAQIKLEVHVFHATQFSGAIVETEEARELIAVASYHPHRDRCSRSGMTRHVFPLSVCGPMISCGSRCCWPVRSSTCTHTCVADGRAGQPFSGYFVFRGHDAIVKHVLVDRLAPLDELATLLAAQ